MAPWSVRATMKALLEDSEVESDPPWGALVLRFPIKTHDVLFPRLFDLA